MNFLANMRISHKISALMIGLVCGFMAIGITYYIQVNIDKSQRERQAESVEFRGLMANLNLQQVKLHAAAFQYLQTKNINDLNAYSAAYEQLQGLLQSIQTTEFSVENSEPINTLKTLIPRYNQIFESQSQKGAASLTLTKETYTELQTVAEKIESTAVALSTTASKYVTTMQATSAKSNQNLQVVVMAIIFTVAILTAIGIYLIYHSIIFPMAHMQSVIGRINRGKLSARVKMITNDELGDLGKAFNKLFDERIQQLEDQSRENERLNNSIISLIRALGAIADKDLTVKVPVSEDITGTVSDAVNLLTRETAITLQQVKDISDQVNGVSEKLQGQAQSVSQLADGERRQVMATSKSLEVLARAMNDVAERSGKANVSAEKAIDNTRLARASVVETVNGIRTIRETISETEKRMKRLGDRSQEISGIVNLINTIAERTHILALNASMHAASAGEAGKGFAVVADEVQRLAESARTSTDEISAMVNNIRVETSDTVNIMNTLISQVAEGSRTAEKAGAQMGETESATQLLVETVNAIAEQATRQAEVANQVRDRATVIRKFTEKTAQELQQQRESTDGLRHFASLLVESVNVFTLPPELANASQSKPVNQSPLQSVG